MKPYPAYKDSGIEWIGEIPEHWDVRKLKGISERTIVGIAEAATHAYTDNGIPIIRSTNIKNGKIEQNNLLFINEELAESNHSRYLKTNDLLTVRTGDAGATAVVPKELENSHCFTMLISTLKHNYDSYYYSYYLNCHCAAVYFDFSSWGTAQKNISVPILQNCPILTLPYKEQIEITRYINRKTSQIDTLIEKKQKQIELLKEERTAIINQAVTKGLNPDVPMKDSGIEWLGEVPEHWSIKKLKFLSGIDTGEKDTVDREEDGKYPFFVRSQTVEYINSYSFDGEAVLTAGDGVGVGKVFHYYNGKFDYHQRVYKISNFKEIYGKYLFYYMQENFHKDVMKISAKSTVDSLRLPMFLDFLVAYGDFEEQKQIVELIEDKILFIDTLNNSIQRQITLLQEYRTALISDAVTGKIDVRVTPTAILE